LLFVFVLTAWRVAALGFVRLDLFTDEAQYWFWSTDLALGYFSKPPLIAWVIRAATALAGTAEAWAVRLPAPLIHGAAALAVAWAGVQAYGYRTGALGGAIYATLPAVTAGSMVISTDTPMLLCFALALGGWFRLAARPSVALALTVGLVAGLGFLAKYAMLYFWLGAALSAMLVPRTRVPWRMAAIALAAFAAVAVLNLGWNATQGFVTLSHTVDNANWREHWFNPLEMLEFLGAQLGVFGPITFAALVAAWLGARRGSWGDRSLTLFSLPILAIVTVQALRSEANANWAAATYVAGSPLAAAWLAANAPRGLKLALALHLAVAVALPVAARFPEAIALPGGRSVFARQLGRADLAREIAAMAQAEGLTLIVADNRGLLSDLLHGLRDTPFTVHTPTPAGPPRNHYEMAVPLPPAPGRDALWITGIEHPALPPGFTARQTLRSWRPTQPAYARHTLHAHRLTAAP
jgi:4-amino-4-deoxy-L-arabinose transferase-like glycosyltransferase